MKTPLALLIAATATLGGLFLGSTGAARADDLGYFQEQVDPYLQKPKFIAPGPAFDAARAAHIPVVASHDSGLEQPPIVLKYADGHVPIDYAKAGALLADWAIIHTKGHMDALVLIATGPISTDSMLNGINGELKHSPSPSS